MEKASNKKLAAKFIQTSSPQERKDVELEVDIMCSLQHPRLLQLYDAYDNGKSQMCLIMEWYVLHLILPFFTNIYIYLDTPLPNGSIDGGELFERVLDDDFVLTEKACSIFVRQICEGLAYIHSQSIVHLDMKARSFQYILHLLYLMSLFNFQPENVLCVTRTGNRVKLIDFGFARRVSSKEKLQVMFGTPEFAAPEVVNFEEVKYTTDMYGCMFPVPF